MHVLALIHSVSHHSVLDVTTCDNLFTRIAAGLKFDEGLWL